MYENRVLRYLADPKVHSGSAEGTFVRNYRGAKSHSTKAALSRVFNKATKELRNKH